jgi:DNA-binding Xre family transcriptional regulator
MEEQTKKEGYIVLVKHNGYEQEINLNLNEYVGYRVKMLQKTKKISNKILYKKAGFCNQTIVSRIKRGKNSFQINTIYRLCVGLDCKSSDLLPF